MIPTGLVIGVALMIVSMHCHDFKQLTTAASTTEYTEHACLIDADCMLFSESMTCDSTKKICKYRKVMFGFASLNCVNFGCPEGAECDHQTQSCRQTVTGI